MTSLDTLSHASYAGALIVLLNRFPLFQASELKDLVYKFENAFNGHIRTAGMPDRGLAFSCNSLPHSKMPVFYLKSRSALDIDFAPVDYITIVFQTFGSSRIILNDQEIDSGPQSAGYIIQEGVGSREIHSSGFKSLSLHIEPDEVKQTLSSLCAEDVVGTVRFEQPAASNRMFVNYVRQAAIDAVNELNVLDPRFQSKLVEGFYSILVVRLLLYVPHSHSHLLDLSSNRLVAKLAEDYIAENFDKPINIDGIASATGVSVRSIYRHFQQNYGESPRDFLKRFRLDQARSMLQKANERRSVMAIGIACGFRSLGHFAEAYRKQFGELPSETLKRR